jgi:hypothetical protein
MCKLFSYTSICFQRGVVHIGRLMYKKSSVYMFVRSLQAGKITQTIQAARLVTSGLAVKKKR